MTHRHRTLGSEKTEQNVLASFFGSSHGGGRMSTALTASSLTRASGSAGRSSDGSGFLPALLVVLVAGMSTIDSQFYGVNNIITSCATPLS